MATTPWLICYFLRQGQLQKQFSEIKAQAFHLLCVFANFNNKGPDAVQSFAIAYCDNHIAGGTISCSTELLTRMPSLQGLQEVWHSQGKIVQAEVLNPEVSLPAFLWCLTTLIRERNVKGTGQGLELLRGLCSELIQHIAVRADRWAEEAPNASVQEVITTQPNGPSGSRKRTLPWILHAKMNHARQPKLSLVEQASADKTQINTQRNIMRGNLLYLNQVKVELPGSSFKMEFIGG